MRQKRRPIIEALKRHPGKRLTPFHTPGHLQGKAAPPALRQWWGRPVFEADLTEVPGLDDLHAPAGAIKKAQDLAADLAGAGRTFFLVNGSTAGIQAMFLACAGPGDKVILPRTVHRAAVAGLILSGADPVFLPVRRLDDFDIPLPPPAAVYSESLARNPGAKALFAVYPDYYGVAVDLAAVADVAREHGLPLLADAAHGVLFGYDPEMPAGAVACGADAVVESVHKRAGALTQAAWLHIQGNRLDSERVGQALQLLTTTSPSYLLLASLDAARRQLALSGPRICRRQVKLAADAREALSRLPGARVLGAVYGGYRTDPTRLVINFAQAGIAGPEAADVMRRSGVSVEMADCRNIVVLFNSAHGARDVRRLVNAAAAAVAGGRRDAVCPRVPEAPPRRLTPREAWLAAAETVPVEKAPGRVSAETVAVTPPGFPVLLPGEEVTREVVSYLQAVRAAGLIVHGIAGPKLKSLRVVR